MKWTIRIVLLILLASLILIIIISRRRNSIKQKFGYETMRVNRLPSLDAGITGTDNFKYPDTISIIAPRNLDISAYGVVGDVILAPEGWTVKMKDNETTAQSGADGSRDATLIPAAANLENQSEYVKYYNDGGCAGCAEDDAAPLFPGNGVQPDSPGAERPLPSGIITHRLSNTLISYRLPNTPDGMEVRGVAYYDSSAIESFKKLEISLPKSEHKIGNVILEDFIQRYLKQPQPPDWKKFVPQSTSTSGFQQSFHPCKINLDAMNPDRVQEFMKFYCFLDIEYARGLLNESISQ